MTRLVALLLFITCTYQPAVAASSWRIGADTWAVPRHSGMVLQLPALRAALAQFEPGDILAIHYPGGEEGSLWAQELRSWLVSLGVASNRIAMHPGSGHDDFVELGIEKNNEEYRP